MSVSVNMMRCRLSVDMMRYQCNVTDSVSDCILSLSLRVKSSEVREIEVEV